MPPKEKAPKCPVAGCQTRLNANTRGVCKQCKNDFCKEHSFAVDHNCMRLSGGMNRSASAPQLVPKVQPGVLVSATAASKLQPKGDGPAAPAQKAPAAAAASAPAAVLQQLRNAPVQQLVDGLLAAAPAAAPEAQSLLIRALGDESAEVRSVAAARGQEVLVTVGAANASKLLAVLLSFLEFDAPRAMPNARCASMPSLAAAGAAQPVSTESRQDRAKAGVVALLGGLATHLSADSDSTQALLVRLTAALSADSALVQSALGAALPLVMSAAALSDADRREFVSRLLKRLDEGRGIAYGLAAAVSACGAQILDEWEVVPTLKAVAQNKAASPASKEHAFLAFQLMCSQLGPSFEPYMLHLMPVVLGCIGDTQAAVREAAEGAAQAVAAHIATQGVSLLMPALLEAMGDRTWKKKETSLQLLAVLARRAPRQVGRCLPAAVPKLMECLQDTHPKVSAAAMATLADVASVILQPEIQKNMSVLIDALSKPEQKTAACLEKLMETTFVNSMDSAALAVVVPVVARGLRERSAELKKMAAMTAGNIFALVNEPRDMAPFVPVILPEVVKAMEHSHPDVRKAAERAKVKLLVGARIDESAPVVAAMENALAKHVRAALAALPEAVCHYAAEVTAELLDDREVATAEELVSALAPMLGSFASTQAIEAVAASAIELHEAQLLAAAGLDIHAGKDLIVNIANIILAFAGRVLLNKTPFFLERGHRYGLIGQNGVGKTTLLTRIAAGDINNFPKDVSCYYIQHEILAEEGTSVSTFMLGQVPEGCTRERILGALNAVGFSEERQAAAVSELSGGWRMKLAIARSMLWDADLLLLDEPTNHLDVGAVEWLTSYINGLKCTVCVVSHDYDFLTEVLTDVIHINDSKLTYYPGTFRDFQRLRPEIAAGLPSPAGAVQRAKAQLTAAPAAAAAAAASSQSADGTAEKATAASVNEPAIKSIEPLKFPDPGPLDGIRSRVKTVMKMVNVSFKYETATSAILTDATVRLTLGSRVALVGLNGAGKTTLLKLLVGDLEPTLGIGEVWKHHNLRVAYIAQHSMHHLEEHVESTPLAYIQDRFYLGRDKELAKLATLALEDDERELMTQRGEIDAIIGRAERGKQLWYEVQKVGRKKDDTVWEPLEFLTKMQPYVLKLVKNYDEKMKAMASGVDIRPLTAEEVKRHLGDFGINEDLAVGKIRRMSGGQKSRLVLAAALWGKPHIIALDEPTNYLDNTTLAALTKALQLFKGGVVTISHNEAFVHELCNELFHVGEGKVVTELIGDKKAKADEKVALKAAKASRDSMSDATAV